MANKGLYCAINFLSFNDFRRKFSSAINSTIWAGGLGGNPLPELRRGLGKGGLRGRGFSLPRAEEAAGDPCPAQLPVLPTRCGESSPSCHTVCAAGTAGTFGMRGPLPAEREVAMQHPHRRGCSPHAVHTGAEPVPWVLTPY